MLFPKGTIMILGYFYLILHYLHSLCDYHILQPCMLLESINFRFIYMKKSRNTIFKEHFIDRDLTLVHISCL